MTSKSMNIYDISYIVFMFDFISSRLSNKSEDLRSVGSIEAYSVMFDKCFVS